MIRLYAVVSVIGLVLWVFCLFDAITTREDEVRNLPKFLWIIIVLFFPLIGSILWLVAGRPHKVETGRSQWERTQPEFPEYDRPGRAAAADPEKDAEFLRQVRERAEEQRRAYREKKAQAQAPEQSADDAGEVEP